jgi:ADP-ribosylglycohydrolase
MLRAVDVAHDAEPPVVSRGDRMAGALLGVHAGDALGAAVEFSSWADIRDRFPDGVREIMGGGPFAWPPGHATDDTDLTRAILLAYLDPGDDLIRTAADNMVAWLDGDWPGRAPGSPPRDVGRATAAGLRRYQHGRDARTSGCAPGQAGNGSLMRCIATALAVHDRDQRIRDSTALSAITHADQRCAVACAAYNEIAAALIGGTTPEEAVAEGLRTATELSNAPVATAIGYGRMLKPAMLAMTGQTFLEDEAAGFVLDSLSLAVAAVLDPRPFPEVLVDIVRIGNDTDSNGAIAGGLLGARDGASAIPTRWVQVLQFADEFITIAAKLTG